MLLIRVLQTFVILAAVAAPFALPDAVLAHERREVGPYTFVVGWTGEPAFSGQKNGVDLKITRTDNGEAVEGAEKTLKLEVIQGGMRREFPLRGVFRTPGAYTADLVPAKDGDYRFRFFGMVGTTSVEQTFDSAEGRFNKVNPIQEIYFPATEVAPAAPAAQSGTADAAAREAANATTMATIGLVAGGLGILLGVLSLASNARRNGTATAPTPGREGARP